MFNLEIAPWNLTAEFMSIDNENALSNLLTKWKSLI